MHVQLNGLSLSKILWNAEGGVPYKSIHAEYPFTIKCDYFEPPMPVQLNGLSLSKILWNAEGGVPYKNIHAEYSDSLSLYN